ncbi:MAG: hypothetical protein ACP5R4_12600 [Armatimonadota bacterium]
MPPSIHSGRKELGDEGKHPENANLGAAPTNALHNLSRPPASAPTIYV